MKIICNLAFIAAFAATCVSANATALVGQEQGQIQGQAQQASSSALAVSNSAGGAGGSSSLLMQNNIQPSQSASQSSINQTNGGDTVVNASGGNSLSYFPRQPVATALAPALTSGFDTCMGSSSAGMQAVGFGLSVGSTWTDENCKRLKNSRELRSMGFREAAVALLCQDPAVASAMRTAGTPCNAVKEQ